MITQERLKYLLKYDPNSGIFVWIRNTTKSVMIGDKAGSKHYKNGYHSICIDGKRYLAHRLAWLYMTGIWPKDQIDHINGIRDDNRWTNLRTATCSENHQNIDRKTGKSGYRGVTWHNKNKKWMAQIRFNKTNICLGYFDDPKDAHEAHLKAKQQYHTFQPTLRNPMN